MTASGAGKREADDIGRGEEGGRRWIPAASGTGKREAGGGDGHGEEGGRRWRPAAASGAGVWMGRTVAV